jgi:dienelactone hydrolase
MVLYYAEAIPKTSSQTCLSPASSKRGIPKTMALREIEFELQTSAGAMRTFWAMPDGKTAPLAIMSPDGPGYRDELKGLARRFAEAGFCCVLADWLYRYGPPVDFTDMKTAGSELMRRVGGVLTNPQETLLADARAVIAYAKGNDLAKTDKVVTVGYCWGASAVLNLLAGLPDQVVAGTGWHPFWLDANDEPMPMHLDGAPEPPEGLAEVPPRTLALLDNVRGELHWGAAASDRWINQASFARFGDEMKARNIRGDLEVCSGTLHGFAIPGGETYDRAASEHHIALTIDLWRRNLA